MPWWLCRFFSTDTRRAAIDALDMTTEERVDKPAFVEQLDSLALEDFQQELEGRFVDESYRF